MSERVRRYQDAMLALDIDTLGELRHPDYECFYPQSGERFSSHEQWAAAHRDYRGRFVASQVEDLSQKGGTQRATVTTVPTAMPFGSTPIINMSDTGDLVVVEGRGLWPDGKVYHWVLILEYRDHLVWRETQYFAEPFAAPEWRSHFVEQMSD
jgi:hypothetical protein